MKLVVLETTKTAKRAVATVGRVWVTRKDGVKQPSTGMGMLNRLCIATVRTIYQEQMVFLKPIMYQ